MSTRDMYVPIAPEGSGESLQDMVARQIRKERKKMEKKDGGGGSSELEMLSEVQVLSSLSASQQAMLTVVQSGPINPATNTVVTALQNPPAFGFGERAALVWCVNATQRLAVSSYNAVSALRSEALIGFLVHGLDPRKKSRGLFGSGGGGLSSLLLISTLGGGSGFGLSGIFGGGSTPISTYPGLS